jgi:pilus assembly protein Flp/PilA
VGSRPFTGVNDAGARRPLVIVCRHARDGGADRTPIGGGTPEAPFSISSRQLVADRFGATAIEYALIASGIGLVIITAVNSLGTMVSAMFSTVANIAAIGLWHCARIRTGTAEAFRFVQRVER